MSWPPRRSVHCSAASSARRAPDTAAMRSISAAAGSIVTAAAITARTLVERHRRCDAAPSTTAAAPCSRRWRYPAPADRHRQRGARTPCWFLMPASRMPRRRRRVCQRSTSATDRRASGKRAIWSFLIASHTALLIARRRRGPRVQVLSTHASSTSPDGAAAGATRAGPDLHLGRETLRIALAAVHRLGELRGPAVARRCP